MQAFFRSARQITAGLVIAIAALSLAAQAQAKGGNNDNRARFEASLTATGAGDVSGKAKFESRNGVRKFSAEIEGFAPGTMFDVEVAGVVIGKIVVDAFGNGDLNYDDNFEAGDVTLPLPSNFPAIDGGESVEVGPLDGNLQPR